jgi:hypothetical protein
MRWDMILLKLRSAQVYTTLVKVPEYLELDLRLTLDCEELKKLYIWTSVYIQILSKDIISAKDSYQYIYKYPD